jgi:hypothetical protein
MWLFIRKKKYTNQIQFIFGGSETSLLLHTDDKRIYREDEMKYSKKKKQKKYMKNVHSMHISHRHIVCIREKKVFYFVLAYGVVEEAAVENCNLLQIEMW